jgi:hypothetical protein
MQADHPIRKKWCQFAAKHTLGTPRPLCQYFNSGFIGVARRHRDVLTLWSTVLIAIGKENIDIEAFMPGDRTNPFYAVDQDALNVAAMLSRSPLSTVGPEGMGFIHGGFTMFHAVGAPKPWKKIHLSRLLKGCSPSLADRDYLRFTNGPITQQGPVKRLLARLDYGLAAGFSRFYSRPA